jgi:asparagine synthase (glutamine-hydrolysing)
LSLPLDRVVLKADALVDFLSIVEHADDPLADASSLPVWALSRYAATHNKVVLGGDGGDELCGGYLTYLATALHKGWIAPLPGAVRRALGRLAPHIPTNEEKVTFSYKLLRFLRAATLPSAQAHFSWNGSWMPDEAAALLASGPSRHAAATALERVVATVGLSDLPDLFSLQRTDMAEYLANDILVKTDRMSMAHGLETRAPFLEHELAGWLLSRPDHQKIRGQELKAVMRAAARAIYGPAIADRPKQGFSIPVHSWLRGPGREQLSDLLSRDSLTRTNLFDVEAVQARVSAHLSGRRSLGFELWGLMVLVAWHRVRIQSRPAAPAESHLIERHFSPVAAR